MTYAYVGKLENTWHVIMARHGVSEAAGPVVQGWRRSRSGAPRTWSNVSLRVGLFAAWGPHPASHYTWSASALARIGALCTRKRDRDGASLGRDCGFHVFGYVPRYLCMDVVDEGSRFAEF